MTTAVDVPTAAHRIRLSLSGLLRLLLRVPTASYPLATASEPIKELAIAGALSLRLGGNKGATFAPAVKPGDELRPGQPIATPTGSDGAAYVGPVHGKVVGVTQVPDLRGGRPALAVQIEPVADSTTVAFEPMNPDKASVEELLQRVRDAGIRTNALAPEFLADLLTRVLGANGGPRTLILLAADREPELSATVSLLCERTADAVHAAVLLGRIVSANRVCLAVAAPLHQEIEASCKARGVTPLLLEPFYPASLEPLVARAAGDDDALIIPLETGLAAADAVTAGKVQASKVVTVIGPKGRRLGNYRVAIGTRLRDLLAAVKLKPRDRDKVIVGGLMRGFAQYSLDAAIDSGVDGITLVRAERIVPWSDEPCINCGTCIDVCPARLQVQLIGRYSEFGLFDRTPELQIDACFECGLCAAMCTARRPLLQLIRLAKRELRGEVVDPGTLD